MNLIKKQYLFYGAVIIQIVILLTVASTFYLTGIFGKEVRLLTEPVDPTDLFYGDYVILQYDIQSLPKSMWKGNEPIEESNQRVYVVLEKENNIYVAKAVYPDKPEVNDDEVIMTGRFNYQDEMTMFLSYGIEKYYISEGTGKEIENQHDNLVVEVVIAPWGQKKINAIEIQTK